MSVISSVLWFIVAIGVLVTVHEFGHFWVARRLGVRVLRFSVGFGRPIWRRHLGPEQIEHEPGEVVRCSGGGLARIPDLAEELPAQDVHERAAEGQLAGQGLVDHHADAVSIRSDHGSRVMTRVTRCPHCNVAVKVADKLSKCPRCAGRLKPRRNEAEPQGSEIADRSELQHFRQDGRLARYHARVAAGALVQVDRHTPGVTVV